MNETKYLKVHFQNFEYSELRDILLNEDVMVRASTLPGDYFVFIKPDRFEKLKLSLLIDRCMVKQAEDGINVEISRPDLQENT